jgi:hypothetical protein
VIRTNGLFVGALAASALAAPLLAQSAEGSTADGATAEREAIIRQCSAQKFESTVTIDAASGRKTRMKLCANPGSTDEQWLATLKDAIVKIDQQQLPPEAEKELTAQLTAEVKRLEAVKGRPVLLGKEVMSPGLLPKEQIRPTESFDVATYPDITAKPAVSAVTAAAKAGPPKSMQASVKCRMFGWSSRPITCDYLQPKTILVVTALSGFDRGATLRFLRRGSARGEVRVEPLKAGESANVTIPEDVCQRVARTQVEIELRTPGVDAVLGKIGPWGLNC